MTQHDYEQKPNITVIGVGGAGGNAVNNMIQSNLEGVDFVVANTDAQALKHSLCQNRVQLGTGLGAGAVADVGRQAAEDAADQVREQLEGANMAFITAGMGGGTGTGAAPVIARIAKEMGILTIGVVTKPFHFEGAHRMRGAEKGIEALQANVDTLIMIPNQNLFRICDSNTTFADAFKMADSVLHSGVRSVTDLIVMPGLINLDFADIRSVMRDMGKAMMGMGEAKGENRATEAAQAAVTNPLLDDVSLSGARGVLINITGGMDMTLFEVDEVANRIREEVDPEAQIIFGSAFDESMEGTMRVSVVATGFDRPARREDAQSASVTSETGPAARAFSVVAGSEKKASAEEEVVEDLEEVSSVFEPSPETEDEAEAEAEGLEAVSEDDDIASDEEDWVGANASEPQEAEEDEVELEAEAEAESVETDGDESDEPSEVPVAMVATAAVASAEVTTEAAKMSVPSFDEDGEVVEEDEEDEDDDDLAAKVSSIFAKQSGPRGPLNGSANGHGHQNGNAALDVSSIFIENADDEVEEEDEEEEEEEEEEEVLNEAAPSDESVEEESEDDAALLLDQEMEEDQSDTKVEPLVGAAPEEEDEEEEPESPLVVNGKPQGEESKIAVNASATEAEDPEFAIEDDDDDEEDGDGGSGPRRGFLSGLARGFGRGSRDEETGKAVLERLKGCQRLNTGEA